MNPDHEFTLHCFKIHFNIIFPSALRSNDPPFPLAVINKKFATYSRRFCYCCISVSYEQRVFLCAEVTYFAWTELFDRLQTKGNSYEVKLFISLMLSIYYYIKKCSSFLFICRLHCTEYYKDKHSGKVVCLCVFVCVRLVFETS